MKIDRQTVFGCEVTSKCLCGVRPARRRLRARLVSQWKAKQPTVRQVDTNFTGVNFLSADNQVLRRSPLIETVNKCVCQVVVCGYTRDAIARVFSISDGALLHLLKCVPEGTRLGFGGGQVLTLVTCTFSYFILPFTLLQQSVTYRYREFPVPGIFHFFGGIGTNWYRKKVSEPVSVKFGTDKKSRNRYRRNLVPEKSLGTGIGKI